LSVSFVTFSESDSASARELLMRHVWRHNWSEELAESYFAWRYTGRPNGETLLAFDQGRCIGILDSFLRPYRIGGRRQLVRETCDWFCLPEYRTLGVGLHLMRHMMSKPEPIINIGGTAYTQDLLPRLKWASLPESGRFLLTVSARTTAALLARRASQHFAWAAYLVPGIPLVPRPPRLAAPFENLQVRVRVSDDPGQVEGIGPYDLGPEVEAAFLDWLSRAPSLLGKFVVLCFLRDGMKVGVAICRLEKVSPGCFAQIVHLQSGQIEILDWMVSETVYHLLERGAGAIFCRSSCPSTGSALSSLGFYRLKPVPGSWWPSSQLLPPAGRFNFTLLRADDALGFH
jgi:hypothetical protein